ncbi:polysaccharide deacetylase family protein [Fodinicola feengrottensis]|uniref:Polysaccharide deacetylase family protein n=1 Tax=Fodinicola feengrottensis TaxID=435914 RepID=A0ABN2IH51_9ACTN|nr:polysaccharide deacetylase family protein [Fodinicola feengrottensis]
MYRHRAVAAALVSICLLAAGCGATKPSGGGTPSGSAAGQPTVQPSPTPSRADPGSTADGLPAVPAFDPAPPAQPTKLTAPPGEVPALHEITTTQKVAFITMDDGAVRTPKAAAMLRKAGVPVTLFLMGNDVDPDPAYFRGLQDAGARIEDHTQTHPEMPKLSAARQKQEICPIADKYQKLFGKRPTLFRPPYGDYNSTTQKMVAACGLSYLVLWRETTDNGKVFYQRPDQKVHAGDIILMHFRVAFVRDFAAVLWAIKKAGLTPAVLQDYLPVPAKTP